MAEAFEKERREFVRVPCTVFVRYKFLGGEQHKDAEMDRIYEGTTNNLSGGGFLLVGPIPRKEWMVDLLTHRIILGVNLLIPNVFEPVRALTRLAWIEAAGDKGQTCSMGLMFKEITTADHDRLLNYIVQTQLPA